MTMAMAKARPRVSGLRREGHRPRARVPAPPSSCDNRRPVRAVIAICLLTLAGCSIDMPPADFAACGPTEPLPDAGTATPDYWHDAKPIIDSKCASCHVDGGIAPIALVSYGIVRDWAGLIRNAITRKLMPPWPPNDCCESYQHDRSLSAVELDTLVRWIDAGTPEGDPVGAPPSVPLPPPRLSRVDVTLRMPEAYTPVASEETSELRCFVLDDWPYDVEMYVTGVDVRPGNRAIVHHVIVQTIDAAAVPGLKAREGADGRPGLDCRDLQGELHVNGAAGGWTPGSVPQESPDGTLGVPFPAHSQVLLQVHYDVRAGVTHARPDGDRLPGLADDQAPAAGAGGGQPALARERGAGGGGRQSGRLAQLRVRPDGALHEGQAAVHPGGEPAHALPGIARPHRYPARRRIVGLPARHPGVGLPLVKLVPARAAGAVQPRRHAVRRVPLGQHRRQPGAGQRHVAAAARSALGDGRRDVRRAGCSFTDTWP